MAECEQASIARRLVASRLAGDSETETALRKSARVQMQSCLHQEALKTALLSWGVRESSLRALELDVITRTTNFLVDKEEAPSHRP